MVISHNKKMAILCILNILKEYSDEQHPLTQNEIIKKIENDYGLELERKSIGANIDSLIDFGVDIIKTNNGCYLAGRDFEPSEISFLIDAVFSSKAIDSRNSQNLAIKLSKILSKYQRKKYKYIIKSDEVARTENKQLFYTIDILNEAIEKGKQVEFHYNRFYFDKAKNEERKQKKYKINPYFMINNQGRYYLVCNYHYFNDIANYKVELISDIKILYTDAKPITQLSGCENGVDMVKYANENIYMFHNKTVKAILKIEKDYASEFVMEWFGKKANFYQKDNNVYADIEVNEQAIIYWCLQYGDSIELVSPQSTREEIKKQIQQLNKKYA